MDGQRFDRLARAFAHATSRRDAVRMLIGGAAAAAVGLEDVEARKKRARKDAGRSSDVGVMCQAGTGGCQGSFDCVSTAPGTCNNPCCATNNGGLCIGDNGQGNASGRCRSCQPGTTICQAPGSNSGICCPTASGATCDVAGGNATCACPAGTEFCGSGATPDMSCCPAGSCNAATGACTCPAGQVFCGGACCAAGQTCGANGVCVSGGCTPPQVACGTGCVDPCPDGQTLDPATCLCVPDGCPPPQVACGGGCVDPCPSGQTLNPATCLCEPGGECPAGQVACNGTCVDACPAGQSLDAGCRCSCPVGEVPCGGRCVAACPEGASLDGACQCVCNAGTVSCGGGCFAPCAGGASFDASCQCACPAGQTLCADGCRDLASDAANCGVCGNACGAGSSCVQGRCTCSATVACSTADSNAQTCDVGGSSTCYCATGDARQAGCAVSSNLCVVTAADSFACRCGAGAPCSGATPYCVGDGEAARCVACVSNADCAAGSLCQVSTGTCVPCAIDGNCPAGQRCDANTCAVIVEGRCYTHNDCAGSVTYNHCVDATGTCVCGSGTAACSGSRPFCLGAPATATCVQCLVDGDCPGGQTCSGNACVAGTCAATGESCQSIPCCSTRDTCEAIPGGHVCVTASPPSDGCARPGERPKDGERCCPRLTTQRGRCAINRWDHCDPSRNGKHCERGTRCVGGNASPHGTQVCVPNDKRRKNGSSALDTDTAAEAPASGGRERRHGTDGHSGRNRRRD